MASVIIKTSTCDVNAHYISKYTIDFLLIKCENPLHCKGFSHFTVINKK